MYIPIKGTMGIDGTIKPCPDGKKVWVNSERLDAIIYYEGTWQVYLASEAQGRVAYVVDTDQVDMERFIAVANYRAPGGT